MQMGALKYVEELQKKKQSDVLRFLLRVRCWEVSHCRDPVNHDRRYRGFISGTCRVLLYTR